MSDSVEEIRKAVVEVMGLPTDWPNHGNAPLAVTALISSLKSDLLLAQDFARHEGLARKEIQADLEKARTVIATMGVGPEYIEGLKDKLAEAALRAINAEAALAKEKERADHYAQLEASLRKSVEDGTHSCPWKVRAEKAEEELLNWRERCHSEWKVRAEKAEQALDQAESLLSEATSSAYQRGLEDGAKRMENGRRKAEQALDQARAEAYQRGIDNDVLRDERDKLLVEAARKDEALKSVLDYEMDDYHACGCYWKDLKRDGHKCDVSKALSPDPSWLASKLKMAEAKWRTETANRIQEQYESKPASIPAIIKWLRDSAAALEGEANG